MPDFFSEPKVPSLGDSLLGPAVPQKRQQPEAAPPAAPVVPAVPAMRQFGDVGEIRKLTFDRILHAVQTLPPVTNQTHTLRVVNPHYAGPEKYSIAQEKQAILSGRDLSRPLKGTWELVDNATGAVVDKKDGVLANVPYFTQRGTFVIGGNNYSLAHQMRLRSGVYTRQKANGELEAHVNVLPGKGHSHRIFLDPETGVFRLQVGQARIPLVTALRAMGVSPTTIRAQWGELAAPNLMKDDANNLTKLYNHFARRPDAAAPAETKQQAIAQALQEMELDPEVTQRTLGQAFTKVDPSVLFATTKKLLAVARLEADPDDRDAMAFQTVLGPEDLLSERISKAQGHLRTALWKATNRKNLQRLPSGLFTKPLQDAIMTSGLGQPGEEINPLQVYDQQGRVSRMGVGGIPSLDAIPDEARSVQASHLGFIDPVVTPESSRVGVDSRFVSTLRKGADGRIYAQFRDVKTGQPVWKSAQDMAEATIAFPNELNGTRKYVRAMANGKLKFVARDQVQYELPAFENAFSVTANMVPLKSAMKGQRAAMAQRMLTQALPLVRAEAPYVQNGMPDSDKSYEEHYAKQLGALHSQKPGTVTSVTPDAITVKYTDGTTDTLELYNNFPNNRKTALHQTPTVRVGQPFQAGELLARSNFTDAKGVSALGLNARVAYIPWKGENFEDAVSITESFAKRIASEHLYQHELGKEEGLKTGLSHFIGTFPGRYDRRQLDVLDEDGAVKVGTVVHEGDPLVLGVKKRERTAYTLHQARNAFTDASQTWEHHAPGIVTDVVKTPKGTIVTVKSTMEAQVGDKLCYDPETRLLTKDRGWVYVSDIQLTDQLATMNPETEELEWQYPTHLHSFQHDGEMYKLVTKHVDMLVTPNHDLWVARPGQAYSAMQARDFYAAKGEWQFRKDVKWTGKDVETMQFKHGYHASNATALPDMSMDLWLEFLGIYIAEGHVSGTTVNIGQFQTSPHFPWLKDVLQRTGLPWHYDTSQQRFVVTATYLADQLRPLGNSYTKFIPEYVQELCPRQLRLFLDAYLNGDGHRGATTEFGSSSYKLIEGLQLICFKLQWSASIKPVIPSGWGTAPHWRCRINTKHLRPWWKHSRTGVYKSNEEAMVPYSGAVYCVTVPNHILIVERRTKTYLSLNSGRYG